MSAERLRDVLDRVARLDEAADSARAWTQPTSCGRDLSMPCRHPECCARAANYSYMFAKEAAHEAHQLERLLAGDTGRATPAAPLKVDEWLHELELALYGKADNTWEAHRLARVRQFIERLLVAAAVRAPSGEGRDVLQAVLDAIAGTLDPHTQIADHPNVKFAQMTRLKLLAGEGRPSQGCINCGARYDGGYLSGWDGHSNEGAVGSNEGAVGPFCSQCWEFLRETFHNPQAYPDELRKTLVGCGPLLEELVEAVTLLSDGGGNQAFREGFIACRSEVLAILRSPRLDLGVQDWQPPSRESVEGWSRLLNQAIGHTIRNETNQACALLQKIEGQVEEFLALPAPPGSGDGPPQESEAHAFARAVRDHLAELGPEEIGPLEAGNRHLLMVVGYARKLSEAVLSAGDGAVPPPEEPKL